MPGDLYVAHIIQNKSKIQTARARMFRQQLNLQSVVNLENLARSPTGGAGFKRKTYGK